MKNIGSYIILISYILFGVIALFIPDKVLFERIIVSFAFIISGIIIALLVREKK